jgi:hypothetical protein
MPPCSPSLVPRASGQGEFAIWWKAHDIRGGTGGQKLMHHPKKGVLRFEHASFQANDDPALKLIIYTPVSRISPAG